MDRFLKNMAAFVPHVLISLFLLSMPAASAQWVTLPSGVRFQDVRTGTGAEISVGSAVKLKVSFRPYNEGDTVSHKDFPLNSGLSFTIDATPCSGPLPAVRCIQEGLRGMKTGGQRILLLPPRYKDRLVEVELTEISANSVSPERPVPINEGSGASSARYLGKWVGVATSSSLPNSPPWRVELTVTQSGAQLSYPSRNCSVDFTMASESPAVALNQEHVFQFRALRTSPNSTCRFINSLQFVVRPDAARLTEGDATAKLTRANEAGGINGAGAAQPGETALADSLSGCTLAGVSRSEIFIEGSCLGHSFSRTQRNGVLLGSSAGAACVVSDSPSFITIKNCMIDGAYIPREQPIAKRVMQAGPNARLAQIVPALNDQKRFDAAFRELKSLAAEGDAASQVLLGDFSYSGPPHWGFRMEGGNRDLAIAWWQKAAEQNNHGAKLRLALTKYSLLNLTKKQRSDSIMADLREQADSGSRDAQYLLGRCFDPTIGDPNIASLPLPLPANGYAGEALSASLDCTRDAATAARWYSTASSAGDERARAALEQVGNYQQAVAKKKAAKEAEVMALAKASKEYEQMVTAVRSAGKPDPVILGMVVGQRLKGLQDANVCRTDSWQSQSSIPFCVQERAPEDLSKPWYTCVSVDEKRFDSSWVTFGHEPDEEDLNLLQRLALAISRCQIRIGALPAGDLSYVAISTSGLFRDVTNLRNELERRYGQSRSVGSQKWVNDLGAASETKVWKWAFPKLRIIYQEGVESQAGTKMAHGLLEFFTNTWEEQVESEKAKNKKPIL